MISFFKEIGKSISDYGAATRFIFKHKLAWFFLLPLLLNLLLFFAGTIAVNNLLETLQQNILAIDFLKNADFWGISAIRWTINGVLWIVIKILFFFIFAYLGAYITLIIMSPVLAFLSEKTEKILLGNTYKFDIQQLIRDIVRAILIVIRNGFLSLLIVLLVFIYSLVSLFLLYYAPCYFIVTLI